MTEPDDMPGDRGGPSDRMPMSRRAFLRTAGVGGLGLALGGLGAAGLSGCARGQTEVTSQTGVSGRTSVSGPTIPGNDLAVGAEPSAYQAPAPILAPSSEDPSVEIAADICVVGGGAAGMGAA